MKHIKQLASAALLLSIAGQSYAQDPSWDFLQFSYENVSDNENNSDYRPSGLGIAGASSINDSGLLYIRYQRATDEIGEDKFELENLNISAGGRFNVWKQTDLYGLVGYANRQLEGVVDRSDDGIVLTLGVRSVLIADLELGLSGSQINYAQGAETEFNLSAQYYFAPSFSVGAAYISADTTDTTQVQMSVHF
ncbi:outer membrane beta-barrel protein [Agaribacterium sp. ZY112]|uniref:outer membrane beta-barrel protein n=1 Tax=Agaribacterium sp. ZY112 TaxID=3233574 RepID=UPI003524FE5B